MAIRVGFRLAVVIGTVLLAATSLGCPEANAIWVEEASTATSLVFRISTRRGGLDAIRPGYLQVTDCEDEPGTSRTLWMIVSEQNGDPLTRIAYGVAPSGYSTVTEARVLSSGCYTARLAGTGSVRFRVRDDGTIQ